MELRRRETGESFVLEDGMVFGRLQQCGVRIQEDSISRRHACIELDGESVILVDLGSSNGIFHNGVRQQRFQLRPGDLVTLGAVAFDVVGEKPVAASVAPAPTAVPDTAARERARLRRELTGAGRSRGLGDLGQQPFLIQALAGLLGLAVLYAVVAGVRLLAGSL